MRAQPNPTFAQRHLTFSCSGLRPARWYPWRRAVGGGSKPLNCRPLGGWFRESITECPIIEMLTIGRLRHAFSAAFAALFLIVLFAIFIVPSSATVCGGIPVWTPIFSGARVWNGAETDLVVTIQRDGSTFVGMNFVPAHQLPSAIASALALGEERTLVLRVDRRSPFGATRAVFRAAQTLGVGRIVLPTGVYSISDLASVKALGPAT